MTVTAMLTVCFVILLFSEANLINFSLNENSDSYGPYNLWWSRYETCSGPKANNLTDYSTALYKQGESYVAWVNLTFLTQVHIDEVRITVNTLNNNRSKLLLNYKLNNPCQHYAVAAIIEKELNAKNCIIKKGNYTCFINFTEITQSFFGSSFFYGEYVMKATALSKSGNVICLIMNHVFDKKLSKKTP